MPSPRIVTLLNLLTRIPTSEATDVPEQPVCGSPRPVIAYPFRSSATFDAPITIHGAPETVQVTLLTSLLFSVTVKVLEMVPLISAAKAIPRHVRAPITRTYQLALF